MTDLTKITTPFGLLDEATQEALRECGGPWEIYTSTIGWRDWNETVIDGKMIPFPKGSAIRQKPQPPKPREWWCCNGFMFKAKDRAKEYAEKYKGFEIIHVREVLP